jgi:hypothetical protein
MVVWICSVRINTNEHDSFQAESEYSEKSDTDDLSEDENFGCDVSLCYAEFILDEWKE